MPILVEACVDSVRSALSAQAGGAGRLELCAALFDGGLTPSAGMIRSVVARTALPVHVIVRPRGGDFRYSAAEMEVMLRDIEAARGLGVAGLVVGALRRDGTVDEAATRRLVEAAGGAPVTFHRAFDLTPDLEEALDAVVASGARRVLTSGGARSALAGAERIGSLVERSAGRVVVMAGGGVRAANVAEVVRRSGVREVHLRAARPTGGAPGGVGLPIRLRAKLPEDEMAWEETDEAEIRACVEAATRAG